MTGTVATTVNNTRIIAKTITFCSDQGAQRILFCGHFIFHVLPSWSGIILCVTQCTFRLYFVYINYQRNLEILY